MKRANKRRLMMLNSVSIILWLFKPAVRWSVASFKENLKMESYIKAALLFRTWYFKSMHSDLTASDQMHLSVEKQRWKPRTRRKYSQLVRVPDDETKWLFIVELQSVLFMCELMPVMPMGFFFPFMSKRWWIYTTVSHYRKETPTTSINLKYQW